MLGLSPLGIVHTALSLVAVGAGVVALVRGGAILPTTRAGRIYVLATALTCVTGFGIFRHGGFGKPHALGVMTLVVLALAASARRTRWFGRASTYVETVSYTLTFFFHMVPGIVETTTRLPSGAPLASGPDDPLVQRATGVALALFLIGVTLQIVRIRASRKRVATTP